MATIAYATSSPESHSRSTPAPEANARRIREVHRYYEPCQTPVTPSAPLDTFRSANALSNHQPTSSPDKALTAFCQLAALRLRARRVLLVFFDVNKDYVLAEATKSLSLQRDARCDAGDELWLGHSTIPKGFTVCEDTHSRASRDSINHDSNDETEVDIVSDLQEDPRYSDSIYVTGYPSARFYAGVPIVPRKVNVGVLCILDDQPREGMTDEEVTFMVDISAMIAEHLETLRARLEYRRGTQMAAGMSEFIQASSTNSFEHPVAGPSPTSPENAVVSRPQAEKSPESHPVEPAEAKDHGEVHGDSIPPQSSSPPTVSSPERSRAGQIDDDTRSSFQTAATIIQKALEVDVYFLDASTATYGALVDDSKKDFRVAGPGGSASGTADEKDMASVPILSATGERSEDEPHCKVLGSARREYGKQTPSIQRMPTQFLRTLLRRHQRGKIWTFDENGLQIATDGSSADSDLSTGSGGRQPLLRTHSAQSRSERKQRRRVDNAATLNSLFPGARSLALMPMWDHTAEKWLAGVVLVTYSPLRTFSDEDELSFMTAFCDVILADAARRSAEASLQNKTAFTASITHELRTPLHGILGTVEHLYDEVQSSVAAKMVAQIELCGKTLLDVIDHLLDFSEVNQYSFSQEALDPLSDSQQEVPVRSLQVAPRRPSHQMLGSKARLTEVSLDSVTEQVIDAITYSHLSTFDHRRLREYHVSTIIDIDHALEQSWQCRLPVGAWKRVCMNLVSNALKYTTEGYIYVSLKQKEPRKRRSRRHIMLSVQDTGRGMSQAFMTDSLFQAFAQESSFSEGAGLGMNVVAKIVRAMGGKLDVQSTPGKGTTVTVVIPIDFSANAIARPEMKSVHLKHVSMRLLGNWDFSVHTQSERGRKLLRETVKEHLEGLGVTVGSDSDLQPVASINLIFEADIHDFLSRVKRAQEDGEKTQAGDLVDRPIIIVCESYHSSRRLEKSIGGPGATINAHVEYLIEPCGPNRLASAVQSCLPSSETRQLPRRPLFKSRLSSSEWKIPTLARQGSSSSFDFGKDTSKPTPSSRKGSKQDTQESTPRTETSNTGYDNPSSALSFISPMMQQLQQIRADVRTPSPLPQARSTPTRTRNLDILIVDDNHINMQLLQVYCHKQGHRSQSAADGQQAVTAYIASALANADSSLSSKYSISGSDIQRLSGCPQVVLMDINMPVMDGFEATQQIRAFERTTATPTRRRALIVAMTGLGSAEVRQRALASGIDLFFQKPVRLSELTKMLEEHFPVEAG